MSERNVLVGRTINGMQIADDKMALRFDTDGGEVVAKCDGDCCSHTWVEHVELPALGFPAKVLAVESVRLPDRPDDQGGELSFYGLAVRTDRGDILIDYRNESNGYYGGNLSWPDGYHYGGVYGQNNSTLQWKELA